jgi:hypothetical protein
MNVGELLRERDRLNGVIEEAKTARIKLRQINVLIAMYGTDEKVSLNGKIPTAFCAMPDCMNDAYIRGLCTRHYSRWQKQTNDWEEIDEYILEPKMGAH